MKYKKQSRKKVFDNGQSHEGLKSQNKTASVRLNLNFEGDPAHCLLTWEKGCLVTSCRDAVVQSFKVFQEKVAAENLKEAQLKTLSGRE